MSYKRTVHFAETDLGGLMHFSEYPRLIEEAWIKQTASSGLPGNLVWRPTSIQINYKAPLRYRDQLTIIIDPEERGNTLRAAFTISSPKGPAATGHLDLHPLLAAQIEETEFTDAIRKVIETNNT